MRDMAEQVPDLDAGLGGGGDGGLHRLAQRLPEGTSLGSLRARRHALGVEGGHWIDHAQNWLRSPYDFHKWAPSMDFPSMDMLSTQDLPPAPQVLGKSREVSRGLITQREDARALIEKRRTENMASISARGALGFERKAMSSQQQKVMEAMAGTTRGIGAAAVASFGGGRC
jgi:hypothetical protein